MLFLYILVVPAVLVLVLVVASLFLGIDRSGSVPALRRSDAEDEEAYYGQDSADADDIDHLRALVGAPKVDRHTAMPAAAPSGAEAFDDVELEELVEMTNADRRREGLPPLSRDEVLRRHA